MQLNVQEIDLFSVFSFVLETTAFMSPLPPEGTPGTPELAQLVAIDITTTTTGEKMSLELVAGRGFAMALASNLLGTDPDDPAAEQQAFDATREVMNVTAGSIIPTLPGFPEAGYEMSIPRLGAFDANTQWETFTAAPGCIVVDVDGQTVAVRLRKR